MAFPTMNGKNVPVVTIKGIRTIRNTTVLMAKSRMPFRPRVKKQLPGKSEKRRGAAGPMVSAPHRARCREH